MLNKQGIKSDLKTIQDKKNSSSLILNNDGWSASKLVFVTEKSFNDYVLNSISFLNDTIVTDDESSTKLTLDENKVSAVLPESERKEMNINQDLKQNINIIYGYYFRLPSSYLGKRITSYGGQLTYAVNNVIEENYEGIFTGPDVILVGNNMTVIHEILEQPLSPSEKYEVNLTLVESSFKLLNGAAISREKFLANVLLNLTSIYIKGVYFKYANQFTLSNVSIDVGTNDAVIKVSSNNYAKSVEQCFCPKGYRGSSCEHCAAGYFRTRVDKGLGYCVPCKCNGHSQECDVNTGICHNCMHNTTGNHCQECVEGKKLNS